MNRTSPHDTVGFAVPVLIDLPVVPTPESNDPACVVGGTMGSATGSLVTEMTERISTDEVRRIADLAFLHLEPDEVELFTSQLAAVLDHASDMGNMDLAGVVPMMRPVPLSNVMREDEVGEVLDRDEVFASAPATEDGQFSVPPVLGESR